MKNENSNRVNMINANITFCDANTTATSGIPAFAIALAAVKGKMCIVLKQLQSNKEPPDVYTWHQHRLLQ